MATENEKVCFYLPPDEARALRLVATEQRRTMTAILGHAARQIIDDHAKSNGSSAQPREGKRTRAATEGA